MRANKDRDSEMVSFRERVWRGVEREGKKGNEKLFAGFYTRYNLFPPSPAKKVVYARGKEINRKRRMIQKSVETHGF